MFETCWCGRCLYLFSFGWRFDDNSRVGESDELENNGICHKQFGFMDFLQQNLLCSHELYGDWVSINRTDTPFANEHLVLVEVRVFGNKCKYMNNITSKQPSSK